MGDFSGMGTMREFSPPCLSLLGPFGARAQIARTSRNSQVTQKSLDLFSSALFSLLTNLKEQSQTKRNQTQNQNQNNQTKNSTSSIILKGVSAMAKVEQSNSI